MNIDNIVYLKNILGEDEVKKYLTADEEKIKMLVKVLKKTSISRVLRSDLLSEFCYKMVYAKYGKVYARVLCVMGKFKVGVEIPFEYQMFLIDYMNLGYNHEVEYKKLFQRVKNFAKFAGQVSNNYWNELAIVCGMYESQQKIGLHVGYTLDAIINCYYK